MLTTTTSWLDAVPPLDMDSLRKFQRISRNVLDRLADDRETLTQLVKDVLRDPDRLAASRVTLLLNRLSLYQAPDRGFEIRLNMNPRPDNQLVPHDHCYAFATRILTGGYVHVIRRRTNGWEGPFTGADLEPAVVTVERPGSAYTLGESMVHQAVMEPHTVTLFTRGPRRKKLSHAAEELMPPPDSWPSAAIPGDTPEESRPCTLAEYQRMRAYLIEHALIG
ncbi:hypothetical protein OG895_43835 [Streptomyces sp. NBC_00201]|uniref:hypothetical protein n=1 Tax=unclassified Streptomyces TaxID=2593676 RepID=UPI00225B8A26|nr:MULTISPECIES: hypothetical protein [unclassified Streptomyces]MCX5064199.1 hypothetical protein [Streptomyces sp. NBC_00452]MCX5251981.1 hypothetical protein [Streptomyces sp. NBC_00201]